MPLNQPPPAGSGLSRAEPARVSRTSLQRSWPQSDCEKMSRRCSIITARRCKLLDLFSSFGFGSNKGPPAPAAFAAPAAAAGKPWVRPGRAVSSRTGRVWRESGFGSPAGILHTAAGRAPGRRCCGPALDEESTVPALVCARPAAGRSRPRPVSASPVRRPGRSPAGWRLVGGGEAGPRPVASGRLGGPRRGYGRRAPPPPPPTLQRPASNCGRRGQGCGTGGGRDGGRQSPTIS